MKFSASNFLLSLCLVLAGCAGVPISTMAYFVNMGSRLIDADPAALAVAVLHDPRLPLAPNAAPELQIKIVPKVAHHFPVVDEKMLLVPSPLGAKAAGLAPAPAGWQWRIYMLSAAQAERMARIQKDFRDLQAKPKTADAGGSVSIGVGMDSLVPGGDALRYDALGLESWMRMSQQDGFVKLWSGKVRDLRVAAKR